jgi:hypothetical protein
VNIQHRALTGGTVLFEAILELLLLSTTLAILVKGYDWAEDRSVELLELISLIVCPLGVSFRNIEVTFSVGQSLCELVRKIFTAVNEDQTYLIDRQAWS